MPIRYPKLYSIPPFGQWNGHLQTVLPSVFRTVRAMPTAQRERINTPDNDFLDIDWYEQKEVKNDYKVAILTHGLEGNSQRPYIQGLSKILWENGWNVVAWNCRACSGEINRQLRLYNHGDVEDINTVTQHIAGSRNVTKIILCGYSMGGNISIKYAAFCAEDIRQKLAAVLSFSAPLDMQSSTEVLAKKGNQLYKNKFIDGLISKARQKIALFPDKIDIQVLENLKNDWNGFIDYFATTFGSYQNRFEFYEAGSALRFLPQLEIPTLLVQAKNDPMLTPLCYPTQLAQQKKNIHLDITNAGGHCGFSLGRRKTYSWADWRALEFLKSL